MNSHLTLFRRTLALRRSLALLLVCVLSSALARDAGAVPHPSATNSSSTFNLNFHFGKDIAIGAVVIGAVAGVGIYLLVRKGPGITGCVVEDAHGLQMRDESDQRTYELTGKLAMVKSGERMRVYGSKRGKTNPQFVVRKSPKIFGPCAVSASTP